jgi:DNA-binding NarL/FixJ family response regulator
MNRETIAIAAAAPPAVPVFGTDAGELLRDVSADPAAPVSAAVCAPGGFGKSTLVGTLARVYAEAGVPVATPWRPAAGPGDAVLLVDDAHRLTDTQLEALLAAADRPDGRLIVAYRPWPRPAALIRLAEILRRGRSTVTLPALTPDQLPQMAPEPARSVIALAGGVPRYVHRLLPAFAGNELPARVPAAALAPFAPELDELSADLRRLLLAIEAGAGVSVDLVAALLGREPQAVGELVAAGQATGLLTAAGGLVPVARYAVAALGPIAERIAVRQRLAELQMARGGAVLPLVRHLLPESAGPVEDATAALCRAPGFAGPAAGAEPAAGAADLRPALPFSGPARRAGPDGGAVPGFGPSFAFSGLAAGGAALDGGAVAGLGPAFEAAGEEALGDDPALAARLFAAAAAAGRPAASRRALATALTGDLDQAARLADRTVATGSPAQRAEAAYVAAVAVAHRGQLDRAAELLRWTGPGPGAGFRAVCLSGTGRVGEAGQQPAAGDGPPTLLSAAASLMARGVRESLAGPPGPALSTLIQAASLLEPTGSGVLLPDSPAALAALVGLHSADLDSTEATLDRAVRAGLGGPLLGPRHLLLQAWSRMLRGQLSATGSLVTEAAAVAGRDRLFAAALRVGMARRDSDLVGLRALWPDACQVLIGQPVDLFMLLPLGELAVAAARLGEYRRVATHLAEADRLLDGLGGAPLWSAPLHWSRLHAAILAEEAAEAESHATALDRLRDAGSYPAALATAAHAWLAVLTDHIDPAAVEGAARGLASLGLAWDGARLAGQAAIRTPDRKAMASLLDCARKLQGRPANADTDEPAEQLLSDREREVAALVLAGLTYKQVADRLFLSAKTVEHHIARIRQRLGCTDRQELLARLRRVLGDNRAAAADGAVA